MNPASDVMRGKTLMERIAIKRIYADIDQLLAECSEHAHYELVAKYEAARDAAYGADRESFPTK